MRKRYQASEAVFVDDTEEMGSGSLCLNGGWHAIALLPLRL
jgi:hypothetical protein